MYEVREVTKKSDWEKFILKLDVFSQSFFQSWNWGIVQEQLGHRISRLGLYEKETLLGICLCTLIRARRGKFIHLRHGPVLSNFAQQFDSILPVVKTLAKQYQASFIRMSPLLEHEAFDIKYLRKRGFRNGPIHNMDAENAWVLDVQKTDEDLLSGMRKTTRYLVRKASEMPIKITTSVKDEAYEQFASLYAKTASRHGFVPHKGMQEELSVFGKDNQAVIFLASYQKKVIAGALVILYGDQAVYHHAATDERFRDIPAAYLLQWEIIRMARNIGKKIYNFWGVVPPSNPDHPWSGLTLFKTGFGGKRINYIHAQDLPLTPFYWKTWAIESFRRLRKGY